MRIVCVSYRKWALDIYDRLARTTNHIYLIIRNKEQYNKDVIVDFKPDLILYYGWSWLVPEEITSNYKCIMLHPSPLPKYRGGSPIQNQIITGEKKSAVSLFFMTNEMDAGDIIAQKEFSLQGSLNEIFERMTEIGFELTRDKIINASRIISFPQDPKSATYCKRRTPKDSEITFEEIKTKSAEYLYNKVRMLAYPYPNAFIRTVDGKRLIFKKVEVVDY